MFPSCGQCGNAAKPTLDARLCQTILEKVEGTHLQSVKIIEDKVHQKLYEKEAKAENINKQNIELVNQIEQLTVEASAWQQRARYNENMIATLKFNLQ
ncbi:hypothetical protein RIF29_18687 [Crotalaria pallida]|uniref:Uncharacterized protein n=1 Tax=Crotalaria pallida TaxID=3830 RepID=A0AAN9I3F5_CROPI